MDAKSDKSQAKRRQIPILVRVAVIWIGIYLFLKFVMKPPLPSSLILMYMTMTSIGIGLYVSIYEDLLQGFVGPIVEFLRGDQRRAWHWRAARWGMLVLMPCLAGFSTFEKLTPSSAPPLEQRVIHPAPPREYAQLYNPIPHTPENVLAGKGMFIAYCSPCHGTKLNGKGPASVGFNPPPANFVDPGTIAQLQESFLFWRISTGGVGLPAEGQPWNSAMPRWETRIAPENIWRIIMYEYEGSGHTPRTWE